MKENGNNGDAWDTADIHFRAEHLRSRWRALNWRFVVAAMRFPQPEKFAQSVLEQPAAPERGEIHSLALDRGSQML